MPLLLSDRGETSFTPEPVLRGEEEERPTPSLGDLGFASLQQTNDLYNLYDFISRDTFRPDPLFNWGLEAKKEENIPFVQAYPNAFAQVQSVPEWEAVKSRILREQRNRQISADAGWLGILADVGSGLASPLTFLAIAGAPARVGVAALRGGGRLAVESAGVETVLHANQETRTFAESASAVALSTALGGVLGGAAGGLSARRLRRLRDQITEFPDATTVLRGRTRVVEGEGNLPPEVVEALRGTSRNIDVEAEVPPALRPILEQAAADGFDTVAIRFPGGGLPPLRTPDEIRADLDGLTSGEDFDRLSVELFEAQGGFRDATPEELLEGRVLEPTDATEIATNEAINRELIRRDGDTEVIVPLVGEDEFRSVGAQAIEPSRPAGGLRRGEGRFGAPIRFLARLSGPVGRQISDSTLPTAQREMAAVSTEGFELRGNAEGLFSAAGGTIQNRVALYQGPLAEARRELDNGYARYVVDAEGALARGRSRIQGALGSKLGKGQFHEEASYVLETGNPSEIPQVNEVAAKYKELYDSVYEEARNVGLITDEVAARVSGPNYLNRVYRDGVITGDRTGFVDLVAASFEEKLNTSFARGWQELGERQARLDQLIEDLERPEKDARKLRKSITEELEGTEEANKLLLAQGDLARDLRRSAREASPEGTPDEIIARAGEGQRLFNSDELLEEARRVEEEAGEPLKAARGKVADLRRRLRNLNRNRFLIAERLQRKLQKVEDLEELTLRSMRRAVSSARATLKRLGTLSPDKFYRELISLEKRFTKLQENYQKTQRRITDAAAGDEVALGVEIEQAGRISRLNRLTEQSARLNRLIEDLDEGRFVDPADAAETVQGVIDDVLLETARINSARAARTERLFAEAKKLDPKRLDAEVAQLRSRQEARRLRFLTRATDRESGLGGDAVNLDDGTADFTSFAREIAESVTAKILSEFTRLPAADMIQGPRRSALARALDIPWDFEHNGRKFSDFLEKDIAVLANIYTRTLAPDIEITRRYGSPDALLLYQNLYADLQRLDRALDEDEALSAADRAKGKARLNRAYNQAKIDFDVVFSRLRETRGLATNPEGITYRLGLAARNLNALRFLGQVTLGSLPEAAKPMARHGVLRTLRHGYLPFIRGVKGLKFDKPEAQKFLVATEVVLNSRAHSLFDVGDDARRYTIGERALNYIAGKVGVFEGFAYWTDALKQVSASVASVDLSSSIVTVITGTGDVAKATRVLGKANIDPVSAARIYEYLTNGNGGVKDGDVYVPNTEQWLRPDGKPDTETIRTFNQAVIGETNESVITGGLNQPNFVDSSPLLRLITQFKGFAFFSLGRTTISGLQRADMATFNGVALQVALGAFTWYLRSIIAGGQRQEEMEKADLAKWIDEGIDRSGILGSIGLAQRGLGSVEYIGGTPARFAIGRFSEEPPVRRGASVLESLAGPTGSLAVDAYETAVNVNDFAQRDVHNLRTMLPFQQFSYLKWLFDVVEESFNETFGIPEERSGS